MNIALVHEHLAQDGGAEKVLKVFQELYPEAPTYTLVYDRKRTSSAFLGKDIRTSFIQKLPFGVRHYQMYLPLMPTAIEQFDLHEYDLVLSSSSALSKGVITRPETLHVCYCHSPTRYLWSDTHRYVQELSYSRIVKAFIPFALNRIRMWDRLGADRVDAFLANSKAIQHRIQKYYRRDSTVLYPPVDTAGFTISPKVHPFYLIGGRLVAYKRYDIAVMAFNRLGIPLKIFGIGPELNALRAMAKPNIEFLGKVSQEELRKLYREATAFLHPQEEDFGITAIEAMASGRPVIAYGAGGALETVLPGKTGELFDEQSWEALADAIVRFQPERFHPEEIRAHALQFDTNAFKERISSFIEKAYISHRQTYS
jgi:glycosyltransferase involved in cell wall biosynthesis